MSNQECKMQMLDLYFSEFSFVHKREIPCSQEYDTSFQINYAVSNEDENKIKVTIDTSVKDKAESVSVELQTVGIFNIEKQDIEDKLYAHLVKVNTIAIMLPFIRSQISLLTTQPGITPIMLQPINVNAIVD